MTEQKERVVLTKAGLLKDITVYGLSREEMATKYGLPVSQMRKAIKEAGLKDKKASKVMYKFQDELCQEGGLDSDTVQA